MMHDLGVPRLSLPMCRQVGIAVVYYRSYERMRDMSVNEAGHHQRAHACRCSVL